MIIRFTARLEMVTRPAWPTPSLVVNLGYLYCSDRRAVDRYGNLTSLQEKQMKPEHQSEAIGNQKNNATTVTLGQLNLARPPNALYLHLQTMSVLFPGNPAMNRSQVSITFTSKGGFGQQVTNVFKPYHNNNVSGR